MENVNLASRRFKELRESSNLTQAQIASFLNIDQSYVSKFEKGERKLSIDILEKMCNLFGCTLRYFESEDEKYIPMSIAFRSNSLQNEDLEAIAEINKVALNIRFINLMLEDGNSEK
ncbi:DNA-binding transcriptional regulator, XRE-family HTH domain [Hathewaya proteolytica DSM 3090]|uniref:DNA-binding transcriptional regulator, XRE-family HTH domain n=1 Tax=Hathewaya proteolytica DSM 3090 TaxID=1121331 RepID=A0A1M6SXL4_9CLOT|nr:helix-turn-helix transcriptional regulator [Hathewaya proteolytica]SHK49409.1 DNA-binding transcriptional regulator, XRE-family HTH domain [Hathewaya proteolytica DSM 3090]